jgi:hypothetical protein
MRRVVKCKRKTEVFVMDFAHLIKLLINKEKAKSGGINKSLRRIAIRIKNNLLDRDEKKLIFG